MLTCTRRGKGGHWFSEPRVEDVSLDAPVFPAGQLSCILYSLMPTACRSLFAGRLPGGSRPLAHPTPHHLTPNPTPCSPHLDGVEPGGLALGEVACMREGSGAVLVLRAAAGGLGVGLRAGGMSCHGECSAARQGKLWEAGEAGEGQAWVAAAFRWCGATGAGGRALEDDREGW